MTSVHGRSFSYRERPEMLQRAQDEVFDVAIMGGGITGAAVLRNAALRGLKAVLIEADDFASGTSSGSSKLIHGGLRYLENFEFRLVREAIHERESLKKLYAPLVKDLPFVFPTYKHREPPRWKLNLGLFLYNSFSGFRHSHQNLSREAALSSYPMLEGHDLSGACLYSDGFAEDYRLVIEIIKASHALGALPLSRLRVTDIKHSPSETVAPFTLSVCDTWTKNATAFSIRSRTLINCAGPFSDQMRALLSISPSLSLTQGVHFIVAKEKMMGAHSQTASHDLSQAFVLSDPDLHRILFVIPWGPIVYMGTTDTFVTKVSEARATRADLDYVLRIFHQHFKIRLTRNDILGSWAAVRPLIAPQAHAASTQAASSISRDFVIEENPRGCIHVLGGKLTSHRVMAQSALNAITDFFQRHDPTDERSLFSPNDTVVINPTLEEAVRSEMVLTTMDYIRRRSSIYYHDPRVSRALDLACELQNILSADPPSHLKPDECWLKSERAAIEKEFLWDQGGY